MAVYATPAEVRPLLGNLANQRTDAQIQLSIDAATAEINMKTNRDPPNDWQTSDSAFNQVKKLARYLAVLEMTTGIRDFEDRDMIRKEINRMFQDLQDYDKGITTDFSAVGIYESWPLNPTGKIWSVRYPNLRKSTAHEMDSLDIPE